MSNKILIVDDQAGIRLLLEEILKSEGYETVSAKTGKQACELAEQQSIDLVIMDYNLPIMNGSEVLSHLDEIGFTAPVLIITGRSRESIEKTMEYSFVQEIILKPFDIHKLKEMVSGTLTHSS
ncbi:MULTISPECIES: response regulator [Halobacillus]|uniref:Two-component response regulator n=1 Tax=Halobacillus halophilus (strain ATCC 35676 / DSM 2266 / JCM 20832 / KCTC 3685 / LMG 17431 / NBRC 102448 / NCIMB 2269) TaxID=866895 RepID=I0JS48_HALH3|nr:response regulator [Halobacillus halophilus]ASF40912.1 response regulator [Halobacillus halophilus]CCG46969.1 two-component response regulator [Halobacillus halophilus DSM 2266]